MKKKFEDLIHVICLCSRRPTGRKTNEKKRGKVKRPLLKRRRTSLKSPP